MFSKIIKRLVLLKCQWEILTRGKVLFKDKYGLKYYLWSNTRLRDTVLNTKVRTDDTGVIEVSNVILSELKKDDKALVCFDIGAFIGVISLAMAKSLNGVGKVFIFEAFYGTFKRLFENVKELNACDNVHLFNTAISDQVGMASVHLIDNAGGTYIDKPSESSVSTLVTTIDCIANCFEINRIHLMKIDVEGVDDKALKGASTLLKKGAIDYLIIEYDSKMGIGEKISQILNQYNYMIYFIVRNGNQVLADLEEYKVRYSKSPLNILAVSPTASCKHDILAKIIS